MTREEIIIKIENLSKTYSFSNKPALVNINLEIAKGEKIGLIGSNGSGKTTLLRLLMNFIRPNKGKIIIRDQYNLEHVHHIMGFVPETQEGLENFTPRELFKSAANMYGMNSKEANNRANELLRFSRLENAADDLIAGFSKGMAQRTFISLAVVNNPEILLFDEPMSGLDPQAQNDVKSLIKKLTDKTLIYASHNLEEIEEFTTSVIFLNEGSIVQKLLLNEMNQEIFLLELNRTVKAFLTQFQHLNPKILGKKSGNMELQLTTDAKHFHEFIDYCKNKNIDIHRIRSRSILEDVYYKYFKKP